MSEINMTAFVNGYAGLVNNYVVTPIVQHLTSRGVQTTVEELMNILQLPAQRSVPTSVYPNTGAPLAFGGATPMMSPSVPSTKSKTRTPASIPPGGKSCNYVFRRGEDRGKLCGKATAGGDLCNSHLKSLGAGKVTNVTPGVAPPAGIPGAADVNAAPVELNVEVYDETRKLYRDSNTNIIIHQNKESDVLTAVGLHSEAEGKMVALTAAARQQASAMGLSVPDMGPAVPHAPVLQSYPSAVGQVPQAHTTHSSGYPIPQVPSAIPSASPVPFAVPSAIPSAFQVPQMPRQVQSQIPQMPQHMNIPQVPQVPQQVQAQIPQVPQMPQQVQAQVPQMPQQMNIPQVPQQVPGIPVASQMPTIPSANIPSIPSAR